MADILLTHGYFLWEDEKEQQIMKPYPTLGLLYTSAYLRRAGFRFHPRLDIVYLLNELDASLDVIAVDRDRGMLGAVLETASLLPPGFAAGAPWAAELHLTPDARFLYASERRSSTLASFAVDAELGTLTPLASTPTEAEPRGFAISPDGRFLVAVGQASHRLSRYEIDAATGRLGLVASQPVGRNPNWVEIVELPR